MLFNLDADQLLLINAPLGLPSITRGYPSACAFRSFPISPRTLAQNKYPFTRHTCKKLQKIHYSALWGQPKSHSWAETLLAYFSWVDCGRGGAPVCMEGGWFWVRYAGVMGLGPLVDGPRAQGLSYQVSVGFMGISGRGGVYHGRFHPSLEGGFFEGEKVSRCGRGICVSPSFL